MSARAELSVLVKELSDALETDFVMLETEERTDVKLSHDVSDPYESRRDLLGLL